MSRKKKPSRKYRPRNEFRNNYSPYAQGHPHYVFGEINGKYKSFGLTSTPKKQHPYVELETNPEPGNFNKSYLQYKIHTAKKKYYSAPLKNWSFSSNDRSLVKHRIKLYNKSTNRGKNNK